MIVETEDVLFVTPVTDPTNWVASFQKSPDFPARDWAEHMILLHNQRRASRQAAEASASDEVVE